jgi:hypothetical protein
VNLLDAMDDPLLFKGWYKKPSQWKAWRAFIATLFALPMDADQVAIYRECTQRTNPPTTPIKESWLAVGRRGGKSFALAQIAVFLACFSDYRRYLAPGERGTFDHRGG